jgi:Fe-S cluster biogenesis protein NfuA
MLTLLAAALLALVVAVMPAAAGGGNNVVIVDNSTNGATMVDAQTQVIPVPTDSVTSSNVAIAINSDCVGCHSSAVAVQILIVRGSPSYFAPGNAAAAVNGGCDSCGAYAYARQHWIQTSSDAHLSGAVRQQIAQIRQQISTTAASILPSDGNDPCITPDRKPPFPCPIRDQLLDAKLDALTAELIQVVKTGLEQSGADATVLQDNVDVDQTTPSS